MHVWLPSTKFSSMKLIRFASVNSVLSAEVDLLPLNLSMATMRLTTCFMVSGWWEISKSSPLGNLGLHMLLTLHVILDSIVFWIKNKICRKKVPVSLNHKTFRNIQLDLFFIIYILNMIIHSFTLFCKCYSTYLVAAAMIYDSLLYQHWTIKPLYCQNEWDGVKKNT